MAGHSNDPLLQLSAALASTTASAQSLIVAIRAPRSPPLSGTLWRNNLLVASEQVFPRAADEKASALPSATTRLIERAPIRGPAPSSVAHRARRGRFAFLASNVPRA